MNPILILLGFTVIGAGLKYIDEVFDKDIFNKKAVMLIAPILVIIWIYLSISDSASATILFSILFAVLLTGKIDNIVFKMSSIALILFFVLSGILNFLWIPLFILIVISVVDEKGNDYVDNHRISKKLWNFIFSYRCCMKLSILGLCIFSVFSWIYLLAFLAFDGGYELVGYIGRKRYENNC